ncbi:hypothetical protein KSS87_023156, partial [Heliosperma pusillum]
MNNPNYTDSTTTTITTALLTTESNTLTHSLTESALETQRFDSNDAKDDAFEDAVEDEVDDDDEEEDEDEEDEDEEEDEGDDDEEERESEVVDVAATTAEQLIKRQKLADGFFEVEYIRKKRICKGVPQYLIKWRGWPESANTWEPVDHLQTCPDVIEAYEESLQSGQKKSSRKRKRKFTQQKKKMQYAYGATKSKISPIKLPLNSLEHPNSSTLDISNHVHPQSGMVDIVVKTEETLKRSRGSRKIDSNGSMKLSPASSEKDRSESQLSGQNANGRNSDIPLQQPLNVEGPTKSTCVEAGQSNQRRGAQRRKSGSVRRFTHTDSSINIDCFGTPLPLNTSTSERVDQLTVGNSDASRKKKSDNSRNSLIITKIVKPISYSASVTNNIQDVAVTFVVMRSDGKEVMVDNKFLKATNPLLRWKWAMSGCLMSAHCASCRPTATGGESGMAHVVSNCVVLELCRAWAGLGCA